jgi:hypothetical protein
MTKSLVLKGVRVPLVIRGAPHNLICWLLLLEEYGVTFEYLQGKIPKIFVADALSCLDIDSLKIQDNKEGACKQEILKYNYFPTAMK